MVTYKSILIDKKLHPHTQFPPGKNYFSGILLKPGPLNASLRSVDHYKKQKSSGNA